MKDDNNKNVLGCSVYKRNVNKHNRCICFHGNNFNCVFHRRHQNHQGQPENQNNNN